MLTFLLLVYFNTSIYTYISNTLAGSECYTSIAGKTHKFWLVGSSIIKNAFIEAKKSPQGVDLGLGRLGISLWWQGRSGLTLNKIKGYIGTLIKLEDPPNFILLHVGGNDLGNIKLADLRSNLKDFILWLKNVMPDAILIWSQILPRTSWRYSNNLAAMDRTRQRLNNFVSTFVLKMGGGYLRYPEIKGNPTFLREDGVHLTSLGNNILINTIQGAFEHFVQHGSCTYPDNL